MRNGSCGFRCQCIAESRRVAQRPARHNLTLHVATVQYVSIGIKTSSDVMNMCINFLAACATRGSNTAGSRLTTKFIASHALFTGSICPGGSHAAAASFRCLSDFPGS